MKRKSIGQGVYIELVDDKASGYWTRPWIDRRRTWRKLKAVKEREAIREANATDYTMKKGSFRDLADAYVKDGCPNLRLEPRPDKFIDGEKTRLIHIKSYFERYQPEEIKIPLCLKYKTWRITKVKKGTGERTVDLDLNTLSNVLNYGVAIGRLDTNLIRAGRPTFRRDTDVKHSRESAPQSGDEIHAIAAHFFSNPRSEVFGWQALFASMTGCRNNELLGLKMDALTPDDPGHIEGGHLFIRRSKGGVYPFIKIGPEMEEMIAAWRDWHRERYPKNPWYFPGHIKKQPLTPTAFNNALRAAHVAIGGDRRTPHGFRSFYVTKRRSDGASDPQIAAEIGDKTVELIHKTYGDRPANWIGGVKLSWLPQKGLAAWRLWNTTEKKFIFPKVDS